MEYVSKESLQKAISKAIEISYNTYGQCCSREQALASDFLTKNTLVALTIWNIINFPEIKEIPKINEKITVFDFPSAYVLIRSMYEAYINMNYVIINPDSDEERALRMNLWDRHALYEKRKMADFIGSKYSRRVEIEKQIKNVTKSIKASPILKTVDKCKQDSFVNTENWTKLKVPELSDRANIHRSFSDFIYKFLSNYSHSYAYSLDQVHAYNSPADGPFIRRLLMGFTEMYLSLTLSLFIGLFPSARTMIDKDKELLEKIDFWKNLKTLDMKAWLSNNGNRYRGRDPLGNGSAPTRQ